MSYIRTFTGKKVWPLDLHHDEIDIIDIAHALSNLCRYTGHCREFYSVAQHCVLAARQAPIDLALKVLLHDASEAYLSDISRPVKHSPEFAGYRAIEERAQATIYEAFNLSPDEPALLHEIDIHMLRTEQRDLLPDDGMGGEHVYPWSIVPWPPGHAKLVFLQTYEEVRHYAPTVQVARRQALLRGEIQPTDASSPPLRRAVRGWPERAASWIARAFGVGQ